ncbi:heme utilization protein [Rhodococcus erythropolis]|uniref:2'-5' RNA ligase family protein n=1 Tax=Rhodococcus erythropolis TaxID=1833 RepID=UPI0012914FE3|nr:2'-5' RNA ligase family protein [Rhodococcus erythropolis]MQP33481.1 heme utilization protein [Rhodococcus erythropolis]
MRGSAKLAGPTTCEHRYGVFLRPDARTSRTVSDICRLLQHQFGLISAAAFPPHITLIGSIASTVQPKQFSDRVAAQLQGTEPFTVTLDGLIDNPGHSLVLDASKDHEKNKNLTLTALAAAVDEAVQSMIDPSIPGIAEPFTDDGFRAHFSLASHDFLDRPDLHEEVASFVSDVLDDLPDSFLARYVTIYRFTSAQWAQKWWEDMTWEHVTSIELGNTTGKVDNHGLR